MTKEYALCDYDQGHIDGIQVGYELAMQRLDKIRAEIEECKQYRGMTGNPVIDKYNVGLDKYYDLGLKKAIKIIDKYKAEKVKNKYE